jgi:hypothetical protein
MKLYAVVERRTARVRAITWTETAPTPDANFDLADADHEVVEVPREFWHSRFADPGQAVSQPGREVLGRAALEGLGDESVVAGEVARPEEGFYLASLDPVEDG